MRIGRTLPPAATPIRLPDILNGLRGLLRGQEEVERFRSELKHYFGVRHCFLVSSGKAALALILEALHGLEPRRDAVVIPAYTCYSVPSAVVRAGLGIRLCDIDRETLDFDHAQLREILSGSDADRILAVIPRHIFGVPADIEQLRRAVAGSGIAIVEDAAQVMGGAVAGRTLGTLGDAGVFSLGRGKALSTVEGGVILTDRDDLAERLARRVENLFGYGAAGSLALLLNAALLSVFMHPTLFWLPKSLPFLKVGATIYAPGFAVRRLSAFQAGLSRAWKERLAAFATICSENERHWRECLKGTPGVARLFLGPGSEAKGAADLNGAGGPVRFAALMADEGTADRLLARSEARGLGIMMTYPDSVDGIPELRPRFENSSFPAARKFARNLLTFPTHGFVSEGDKKKIGRAVAASSQIE
jgi:dTDP-4-amino-4,6-dideoxygalactose transaminase